MGERGSQKGVPNNSQCLKDQQSFEEYMYCDPVVLRWLLITLFLGPKLNVGASLKKMPHKQYKQQRGPTPCSKVLLKARRRRSQFYGLEWVFLSPVIPKCVVGGAEGVPQLFMQHLDSGAGDIA